MYLHGNRFCTCIQSASRALGKNQCILPRLGKGYGDDSRIAATIYHKMSSTWAKKNIKRDKTKKNVNWQYKCMPSWQANFRVISTCEYWYTGKVIIFEEPKRTVNILSYSTWKLLSSRIQWNYMLPWELCECIFEFQDIYILIHIEKFLENSVQDVKRNLFNVVPYRSPSKNCLIQTLVF